ncbi:hypothetical protein [Burkholderia ubonensis]|uniref:hypothetical protein n=1 Tax=Burkholderia ubonensis TaxID=101571 RepID=UPI000ACD96CB|nr:hypothetical protein [Burkholderia ubonensis]
MTKNRSASGVPITGREPYTLSSERLDKTTIAAESGDLAVALMDARSPELIQARKWAATAEAADSERGRQFVCTIDDRLKRLP